MPALLDVIRVNANTPPGPWSRGPNPVEWPDRAFVANTVDICEPPQPLAELPDIALGEDARPFAIVAYSRVPTRCCELSELTDAIGGNMARTVEYRAAHYLWHGTGVVADELCVTNPDVHTVPRTGVWATDLGSVISTAYNRTEHLTPVLLLGVEAALHLALSLQNLTIPYVVSPAFPINAMAVVDADIEITLSTVKETTSTEIDVNRHQWEATQLGRVAFDLTKAVRLI